MHSELRLFLSVDIAGSTRLKNILNHTKLLAVYEERMEIVKETCKKLGCANDCDKWSDAQIEREILERCATEDMDWAVSIERLFSDFNNTFKNELRKVSPSTQRPYEPEPWKALGDELVYAQAVSDVRSLHLHVVAFLKTLRILDKNLFESKKPVRLKGSAWTAGFPIRNRIVEFSFMKTVSDTIYPYPSRDYLGPEMDTGFRLGKTVWPGFLVVSFDLAQLLGRFESAAQLKLCLIGWEELKGVWNDLKYPIIWAKLNDDVDNQEFEYTEYRKYDLRANKYLGWWLSQQNHLNEAKKLLPDLEKIFDDLNSIYPEFGIVRPYFPNDPPESKPQSHSELKQLLEKIARHRSGIDGRQDDPEKTSDPGPQDPLEQFKERFPKPSSTSDS